VDSGEVEEEKILRELGEEERADLGQVREV
jgi:hypothetical protein